MDTVRRLLSVGLGPGVGGRRTFRAVSLSRLARRSGPASGYVEGCDRVCPLGTYKKGLKWSGFLAEMELAGWAAAAYKAEVPRRLLLSPWPRGAAAAANQMPSWCCQDKLTN